MRYKFKVWGQLAYKNGVVHLRCLECKHEDWRPAQSIVLAKGADYPAYYTKFRCRLCGSKKCSVKPYYAAYTN